MKAGNEKLRSELFELERRIQHKLEGNLSDDVYDAPNKRAEREVIATNAQFWAEACEEAAAELRKIAEKFKARAARCAEVSHDGEEG